MAPAPPPPGHSPRRGTWLGVWLLLLAVPAALVVQGTLGDRVLFPLHTDQLSPWRAQVDPARRAALDERALPLATDAPLMFHPQVLAVQRRAAAGETPLWSPEPLGGVPLLAQAVHGALNPLNAPLWWWPGARGYALVAALQCLLAALGALLLARQLGGGRAAGVMAGLGFSLCGFLAVRWHWFQIQGASLTLPWLLLGVERLTHRERSGAGSMALVAAAVGLSFLAGFPPATVLGLYVAAAWGGLRLLRAGVPFGARAGRALRLGAAVLAGVLIGLPQFLPSALWATSGESDRASVDPAIVRSLAMDPASLLRVPFPLLFGHPSDLDDHALPQLQARGALSHVLQKPNANHVETAGTFGVTALLLAVLGLATRRCGRVPCAGLLFGGALFALDTPLLLPVLHLPGLDTSDPRRFLLLLGLGGALLGALGLQRLRTGPTPPWYLGFVLTALAASTGLALALSWVSPEAWLDWIAPRLAAALGVSDGEVRLHAEDLALDLGLVQRAAWRLAVFTAASVLGILATERRPRLGTALLALVMLVDLGSLARRDATFLPEAGLFREPPALAALQGDGSGRLIRFHPGPPDPLDYPLPPNTGLPFGVRDASGYITLAPRRWQQLHEWIQPGTRFGVGTAALSDLSALDSSLLDRLAVDRVLSSVEIQREDLTPLGRVGNAWLYRNEGARPRVSLAPAFVARIPPGDVERTRVLLAPGSPGTGGTRSPGDLIVSVPTSSWDRSVVIEDPGTPERGLPDDWSLLEAHAPSAPRPAPRLVVDEPERMVVEVEAPEDTWLIVADTWAPGWSATVDGEPAPVRPADLALRAVPVPAGKHTVELRYEAPGWKTGRLCGALGLALLLIWLLRAAWNGWRELRRD